MTKVPRSPVNSRKALAGKYLLERLSLKQALIRAGYAESTASTPKQHGLSAEECLLEAGKLDPEADPSTLLAHARNFLARKLSLADPRKESLSAAARTVDVVERHYRHFPRQIEARDKRSFVERAWEIGLIVEELKRRGLLDRDPTTGATKVIDVRRVDPTDET